MHYGILYGNTQYIPYDELKSITVFPLYSNLSLNKAISGTRTPDYIDLDIRAEHIRHSYFLIKDYEKTYNIKSKVMFNDWKEGKLSGPDYTKWVTAYLNVWDKISESR